MPVTQRGDDPRGMSPVMKMVAELPGGPFYTIKQASDVTGIPIQTLRRWARSNRTQAPTKQTWFGKMKVWLYTPDDLKELRAMNHTKIVVTDRMIKD